MSTIPVNLLLVLYFSINRKEMRYGTYTISKNMVTS
jgi:hypothetical protein